MNYVELHIGDYSAATFHLTPLEDGIYWRLLRCYYRDERALPADLAAVERMVGARTDAERAAVALILAEFFSLQEHGYTQERCDKEIARYIEKSKKAKSSAAASWEARRGGYANAMQTQSDRNAHQTPYTRHQSPVEKKKRASAPAPIVVPDWVPAEAWGAFMDHRKAKGAKVTQGAADLIVKTLAAAMQAGHQPADVLNRSIANGWTGVFLPDAKAAGGMNARDAERQRVIDGLTGRNGHAAREIIDV